MIVLYGKVKEGDDATRGNFRYTLWSFAPGRSMNVRFSGRISNDAESDHGEVAIDHEGVIERYDTSKECLAKLKAFAAAGEKAKTLVDLSDLKTFDPGLMNK